jgi:hypothetical protein
MLYFQLSTLFCLQTDPTDFWWFTSTGRNFSFSKNYRIYLTFQIKALFNLSFIIAVKSCQFQYQ